MPTTTDYHGYLRKSQGFLPAATLIVVGVVLSILFSLTLVLSPFAYAKDCNKIEDLDDQLECYEEKQEKKEGEKEDLLSQAEDLLGRMEDFSSQLSITQGELNSLQVEISHLTTELAKINASLADRQLKLGDKINLRNKIIRRYYELGLFNELETIFMDSSREFESDFQVPSFIYIFNRSMFFDTSGAIDVLNVEINSFEKDKKEAEELKGKLETARAEMVALQARLAEQKLSAEEEHTEVEGEIKSLEEEIASLSAKQKSILAAKSGEGVISGYEAAEYKLPDAPFKPAYAAMSYGAFTHYKGMSQYGARGRAEDGKKYDDIIEFYYDEDIKEKDGLDSEKICVEGHGKMKFRDYLYGLGEMPVDWHKEALKTQVVAARSYAYRYIKAGKCICTSTSCQVFYKDLIDRSDRDSWRDAVDDTKDEIIGGSTDSSGYGWYSSTAGGYLEKAGWDVDGDWPKDAYEKKGKSPWFYKAWHTKSYKSNSSTCGRSTPWLNETEMADILNSWRVWKKGSGSEQDHIAPITDCWGGDPYSHSKMKEKADKYGDAYSKVDSISVDISNGGSTSKVKFKTDKGTVEIEGDEFKTVFNLRAPGYVAIRSRLFDIEVEK
jgi:SpoIID/LytB domain protein